MSKFISAHTTSAPTAHQAARKPNWARRLIMPAVGIALLSLTGCYAYPAAPGYGYGYGGPVVAAPPVVVGVGGGWGYWHGGGGHWR